MDFATFMRLNWGWIMSFGGFVIAVGTYMYIKLRALTDGLQALLRAQMVDDYNRYTEKGFAPIYARENFENCWKQYERLGKNGVMSDIHTKFLALPTERKVTQ